MSNHVIITGKKWGYTIKRVFPVLTVFVFLLVITCGCSTTTSASNNSEKTINDLQKQVADLEKQGIKLRNDHDKLDMDFIEYIQDSYNQKAILFLETNSYSTVETQHGHFLLAVDNVEPYLDGVKVHLRVGNPSTITFNGMSMEGFWGDDMFELSNSKQIQKTFELTDTFLPGKWTVVELIIPSVNVSEIKYLGLILTPNEVGF